MQLQIITLCTQLFDHNDLSLKKKTIFAIPLYAGLSSGEQNEALVPPERGIRKVVVSTNIAEASVTMEGIVYVIDCGFVKVIELTKN